jgi:hypothetical protein
MRCGGKVAGSIKGDDVKHRREHEEELAFQVALRSLHHIERVPVNCYPRTVANIVQQALDLGIPEDAELDVYTQYDDNGPELFFCWYVYADPQKGKHVRHK